MLPIEQIRDDINDLPKNPKHMTRSMLSVSAYMIAFGFALLSLYAALMSSSDDSLPMARKLSGVSLAFFAAHKCLKN